MQRDELIGRLAAVPADQKFKVAAAAMYDNSRLPAMIPEDQREQAIGQIAKAMRSEFGQVDKLRKSADADTRRAVGMQAVVEGSKVMSRLKKQWQMPEPGQQVQRGVGPEQRQTVQPEQGQGPQAPASPAALPPDIAAAARAGLSGPPLRSASRLSADRQGARGTGATVPAAQRQGPETQR